MLSSYNASSENTPVGRDPAGEDPDRSRNRPDRVDDPQLEGPPPIDEPKREEGSDANRCGVNARINEDEP
jgi:hypothetical protein